MLTIVFFSCKNNGLVEDVIPSEDSDMGIVCFSVADTQKREGADTLPLSFCDENYFSSSILPCSFSKSFIRFLTIMFN